MGESESKKRSVVHRLVFDRSRFGRRAKAVVRARAPCNDTAYVICRVCSRERCAGEGENSIFIQDIARIVVFKRVVESRAPGVSCSIVIVALLYVW